MWKKKGEHLSVNFDIVYLTSSERGRKKICFSQHSYKSVHAADVPAYLVFSFRWFCSMASILSFYKVPHCWFFWESEFSGYYVVGSHGKHQFSKFLVTVQSSLLLRKMLPTNAFKALILTSILALKDADIWFGSYSETFEILFSV